MIALCGWCRMPVNPYRPHPHWVVGGEALKVIRVDGPPPKVSRVIKWTNPEGYTGTVTIEAVPEEADEIQSTIELTLVDLGWISEGGS